MSFTCVQLFATLGTVPHEAFLLMEFSRQEYWSGLQGPPPGERPNPGIKPTSLMSPALASGSLPLVSPEKPFLFPSQFSSVAQLCLTLGDLMDCSRPGFPVHHQLLELAQTHVHRVDDAIPIISASDIPFFSCLQYFPASGFFPMSQFFTSGDQSTGVSASASVLPMNICD